jgi:ribosomal protein S18 acetylase RimI-like enzyme
MLIRPYTRDDEAELTELTIAAFGPFFEDSFRPLMGEAIFANQHAAWREAYRSEIPALHDPEHHKHIAIAEADNAITGFVAWNIDPARKNAQISHLAVAIDHRRDHLGTALCEHAFAHMRSLDTEVVTIGTGGDDFHAPARSLYESLGCTKLPVAVYYRQL